VAASEWPESGRPPRSGATIKIGRGPRNRVKNKQRRSDRLGVDYDPGQRKRPGPNPLQFCPGPFLFAADARAVDLARLYVWFTSPASLYL